MDYNNLDRSFYFKYYRLEQNSYRDKIKCFEENKDDLHVLELSQQYELKFDYLICLFEIGRYEYFLDKVDEMIEVSIIENVFEYNGLNIYTDLLFRKSACLYNLNRHSESSIILQALIKIDIENKGARLLYEKCRREFRTEKSEITRAISMVFLLSAVSILFMELLIVKPFYEDYIKLFSSLKIVLVITAIVILLVNEINFKYNIGKELGYKIGLKQTLKSINKWFINLSGGKIGDNPL